MSTYQPLGSLGIIVPGDENKDDLFSMDLPTNPPMEGSFSIVRQSRSCDYWLIRQGSTGNTRWVEDYAIITDGVAVAFYDADPTFKPKENK